MSFLELLQQDYFLYSIGLMFFFLVAGLPIGFLLIHKNLGLFSDALSHSLIPGLVGSVFLFGLSSMALLLGALGWGLIVALVFSLLSGLKEKTRDSTLVAISLFGISLGLLLNQQLRLKIDFTHLLFGSPLLGDGEDLLGVGVVSTVAFLLTVVFWKRLLRFCVDPVGARVSFGEFRMNFLFSLLTTMLVVVGFQIFGVLLTTGLLILPNLIFRFDSLRMTSQLFLKIFATLVLAVLCFWLSYLNNFTFSSVLVLTLSTLSLGTMLIRSARAR